MKRRRAWGKTPEELDALATISETDKLRAAEVWRRDASPRFKNLLDAKALEAGVRERKNVERG